MELRALVEATLDFPDEDIDPIDREDTRRRLTRLQEQISRALALGRQGSVLRSGLQVVLAGQPNVGKSSLLNRLAGEDLAIVTEIPGTTRDTVRQAIQIEGVPVNMIDTAGLRESADEVERIGMARARSEMARADVVLVVLEAGRLEMPAGPLPPAASRLTVINKIDLVAGSVPGRQGEAIHVSARTGAGLDALRAALLEAVGWNARGESVFLARERHLRALEAARGHLAAAAAQQPQWEFFAEELRLAQEALGAITGRVSADDLLGEIFARFCIGK